MKMKIKNEKEIKNENENKNGHFACFFLTLCRLAVS